MKHLWCESCSRDARYAFEGIRQIYPASAIGEPAEYARVVRGRATAPRSDQRVITVNGVANALDPGHYNCDRCNAVIQPGEPCACVTVWRADRSEPPTWESAYLSAESR